MKPSWLSRRGRLVPAFATSSAWAGVLACVCAPGTAHAVSSDWRVYRLIDDAKFAASDIAVLPEGGFILADSSDGVVYRVTPRARIVRYAGGGRARRRGDGGRATAARLRGVSAVSATTDGGALIADQFDGRIRRVSPDGMISTVAGGGDQVPRDGVAATAASLYPDAVLALPGGGFLFDDQRAARIFRVRPDGRLETFAGNGSSPAWGTPTGDGGPATAAAIGLVRGLVLAADGAVFFRDYYGVRRVGPDGQISTVSKKVALDLAVAPDGSLILADSNLPVLAPDGSASDLLGSAPGAGGFFAGTGEPAGLISTRQATTVAATPDGGVLFAAVDSPYAPSAVFYVAPPKTSRLAVAIARATLPAGSRRIVRYRVTRRALVRLQVTGRGKTATVSQSARAGVNSVRLPRRLPDGLYLATIHARAGGQGAAARYPVLLGRTLPSSVARAAAPAAGASSDPNPYAFEGGAVSVDFVHRCKRMDSRRVDCQVGTGDSYDGEQIPCDRVAAVTLRRDGYVYVRAYSCRSGTDPGFRPQPAAWIAPAREAPRLDLLYDEIIRGA